MGNRVNHSRYLRHWKLRDLGYRESNKQLSFISSLEFCASNHKCVIAATMDTSLDREN